MKICAARHFPRYSMIALAAGLLASCGGDDNGGQTPPTPAPTPAPAPAPTAPSITSAASVSVAENTSGAIYTATATDPQNDPISWSIVPGQDAEQFSLAATGELSFRTPPNFDLATDSGQDNTYQLTLRATAGGETDDLALSVSVTNDREGIQVTRVATGIVNPVGMTYFPNIAGGRQFLVAEKAGRVLVFDDGAGTLVEAPQFATGIRDGEILAISYLANNSSFFDGAVLLTHSSADGLLLQALNVQNGRRYEKRLAVPWAERVKAALFASPNQQGGVLAAIGDPSGNLTQDAASGYGKLWDIRPGDPYAGASLPAGLVYDVKIIGDGIRAPGGGGGFFGQSLMADQGGSRQHEIVRFDYTASKLDFGWPYYEGAEALTANPPATTVAPSLVYGFGTEPRQGKGIIAGVGYAGEIVSLRGQYIFGDESGAIFSIPSSKISDGTTHTASEIELRTDDFIPNVGTIDSPVGFVLAFQTIYILDVDGEIFRVDRAS